jgi:hypothetical protein
VDEFSLVHIIEPMLNNFTNTTLPGAEVLPEEE